MDVSILHLSDLHRHAEDPIANDALLQSLIVDRKHYTAAGVRPPDLAIVSGDIIQGSTSPTGQNDIELQYREAHDFLTALCDAFFGGDRDRVVIVPGNHDVSDYQFRKSLIKLKSKGKDRVELRRLFKAGTRLRWDWNTLSFYDIQDESAYLQRFAEFSTFYARFYANGRLFSLQPEEQIATFEYAHLGVVVVALNSCYNNDLLNRVADFHPSCIASAALAVGKARSRPLLPIAAWHHNTEGVPYQNDYLHPDHLQCLLDAGVCLGLHGHQHRPEHLHHTFKFGVATPLPLVSAGTLCGPPERHYPRSYNVVELDLSGSIGRLHVRQNLSRVSNPLWVGSSLQGQPPASADFQLPKLPPMNPSLLLQDAATRMEQGHHRDALAILAELPDDQPMARRLKLECFVQLKDDAGLARAFATPTTPREAIHLLGALYDLKDIAGLAAALRSPYIANAADPALVELRNKYLTRTKS